jgi:hypothetical protein
MADTFVLMNENETLGALLNPPKASIDVIVTNPPYVTRGSAIYQQEIAEVRGTRNGIDLRDWYANSGLGLESLFLRYISGALKPGGRAFVIVPLGLLNRTETGPKKKLLDECNIVASIQLPRNTFFNTSQKTYILVLEKRHSAVDDRPSVFSAIARSTGETLNWERVPTPDDNDLSTIAELFLGFLDDPDADVDSPLVKIVRSDTFTENDRWDVLRFWTDDELVALGERESATDRMSFIDEARETMAELSDELEQARSELAALMTAPTVTVSIGDAQRFAVHAGKRITGEEVRNHPGDIPLFSCFKDARIEKGRVDEQWLKDKGVPIETDWIVTVNANGASVGHVYVREPGCALTDDVIAVRPLDPSIDPTYLAQQLRSAVAAGGFLYEAKLFKRRVQELEVELPVDGNGAFDLPHQQQTALAVKRFDYIRQRLAELGSWSGSARIA